MTHETPQQRRTRLIEQYVPETATWKFDVRHAVQSAIELADAVIAATPQSEPAPTKTLDLKSLNYDGTPATRYPSEIESRLIELVEQGIADLTEFNYTRRAGLLSTALAAIKRDLGLV